MAVRTCGSMDAVCRDGPTGVTVRRVGYPIEGSPEGSTVWRVKRTVVEAPSQLGPGERVAMVAASSPTLLSSRPDIDYGGSHLQPVPDDDLSLFDTGDSLRSRSK